jgi:hypothetical protein
MSKENRWEKYRKVFSDLTVDQKLGLSLTLLASASTLVVGYATGVLDERYAGLVVSSTLAIQSIAIPICHAVNRLTDRIDSRDGEGLRYIGGSRAGLAWFLRSAQGLAYVKNTVYRPYASYGALADAYEAYYAAIRRALAGGCQWFDLVVPPGTIPTMPLAEFHALLNAAERAGYEAKALVDCDTIPFMQVTILKYVDGRSAMSVGFGFPGSDEQMVYVSHGPKTVQFHESYFQRLYDGLNAKLLYERPLPHAAPRRFAFFQNRSDAERVKLLERARHGDLRCRALKFFSLL